MTVKYYIFGNEAAQGSQSGSGGVPSDALYGPGEEYVGQVPAAGITITFTGNTKQVTVRNRHDSNYLGYSFDGGVTWLNMGPYGDINEDISVGNIMLRNDSGVNTDYEIIGILQ